MEIMSILAWIVLGGLAGWVASILTKNNARMGILANIVVGIIGAFAGSFILSLLNVKGMTGFNVYTFFVALLGATVLLWLFNMIRGRR
jgi:uncharacterized membrane protein YeaQ/YmgE (transglycosylase-associated protein family)